jgi:hypothetical protein
LPPWIDAYLKRAACYVHRGGFQAKESEPAGLIDLMGPPNIPGFGVGPIYTGAPDGVPTSPTDAAERVVHALEIIDSRKQNRFRDWADFISDARLLQSLSIEQYNDPTKRAFTYEKEAGLLKLDVRVIQRRLARMARALGVSRPKGRPPG